jgi:hypothetical protein
MSVDQSNGIKPREAMYTVIPPIKSASTAGTEAFCNKKSPA